MDVGIQDAKAEIVPEAAASLVDVQPDAAPVELVVHPPGKAGTDTESKFSETEFEVPSGSENEIVPKSRGPSCTCKVARTEPPQVPFAVKVKAREAAAPELRNP